MESPEQQALIDRTILAAERMRKFIGECQKAKCDRLVAGLKIAASVLEDSAHAQLVELRSPMDFWERWGGKRQTALIKKSKKLF